MECPEAPEAPPGIQEVYGLWRCLTHKVEVSFDSTGVAAREHCGYLAPPLVSLGARRGSSGSCDIKS